MKKGTINIVNCPIIVIGFGRLPLCRTAETLLGALISAMLKSGTAIKSVKTMSAVSVDLLLAQLFPI